MAQVVPLGEPVNDAERRAIAFLRANLPNDYLVLHSFDLPQDTERHQIDIAVLAPHAVFLVDVKGTRGRIDVYGSRWYPEGRSAYFSPLAKLRDHARVFKDQLRQANPGSYNMSGVFVQATILLSESDAVLYDNDGRDGSDVVNFPDCVAYFTDDTLVPQRFSNDIRALIPQIRTTLAGQSRPRSTPLRYGNWEVVEALGRNERYTEYAVRHRIGDRGPTARMLLYRFDIYLPTQQRAEQRKLLTNGYRTLAGLPGHPNIISVRDLIEPEEDPGVIAYVMEDPKGQSLRPLLERENNGLTFDQKLGILRGVLKALAHAHRYKVVHRNLTPDAVILAADGDARLTGFEFARIDGPEARESSIAEQIVDVLDKLFQAPECKGDPGKATAASDLFSAGLIFYLLLTGERPFPNVQVMESTKAVFPSPPSQLRPDLPATLDSWLQQLCRFAPAERYPGADAALTALEKALAPTQEGPVGTESPPSSAPAEQTPDLRNLPANYRLTSNLVIETRLGRGTFGTAYKVYETYSDMRRVVKIVDYDRRSVLDRFQREYSLLAQLPPHPHVVKVVWGDLLPLGSPYIVFEFVDGIDVGEAIQARLLTPEELRDLTLQVAEGLQHLHINGVYHQDIKPSNLLWTGEGAKIIDFNVAVRLQDERGNAGGTRRYYPPDLDRTREPNQAEQIDRDVYALALTFYEGLSGGAYPWPDCDTPPLGKAPQPLRSDTVFGSKSSGGEEINPALVNLLQRALSPQRSERFPTAQAFREALVATHVLLPQRIAPPATAIPAPANAGVLTPERPNTNPFVPLLQTLYSQNPRSNAGTRGLDRIAELTYVPTRLDTDLLPAIQEGRFRLVVISGNAGDGKTAFLQKFERALFDDGAIVDERRPNGTSLSYKGHRFLTNYDGSQDEGNVENQAVLEGFFAPFAGNTASAWPDGETRIIAINEGRLIDFLAEVETSFPLLSRLLREGLRAASSRIQREAGEAEGAEQVAIINLNLRSLVGEPGGAPDSSLFDQTIERFIALENWEACAQCDLYDRCYISHNVRTLQDPTAGAKVRERLRNLFMLTHLRARLHITVRDLRSALSYLLVGVHSCDALHEIYGAGTKEARRTILEGFYFNSWRGGHTRSKDRLLALLRDIDMGESANPELDRNLSFPRSTQANERFTFRYRPDPSYETVLLERHFEDLPQSLSSNERTERIQGYQEYMAILRRRHFFERRDAEWREMLPYRYARDFAQILLGQQLPDQELVQLLTAINRGEGLVDSAVLGTGLALRVRRVERGTIRSYRFFKQERFTISRPDVASTVTRYLETLPAYIALEYRDETVPGRTHPLLQVNLDIYEMLRRLGDGYRPSVEELEGFYLALGVFKNALASAPYQEVILTETGRDFYRIQRENGGKLRMERLRGAII